MQGSPFQILYLADKTTQLPQGLCPTLQPSCLYLSYQESLGLGLSILYLLRSCRSISVTFVHLGSEAILLNQVVHNFVQSALSGCAFLFLSNNTVTLASTGFFLLPVFGTLLSTEADDTPYEADPALVLCLGRDGTSLDLGGEGRGGGGGG
jgi:hypothetical protein